MAHEDQPHGDQPGEHPSPTDGPGSSGGPGQGGPGYPAPGYGRPGYQAPGYPAPGYGGPGYQAPGYPAPGSGPYGPAYAPYPGWGVPARKTNTLAIVSLVVGLGSMAICPLIAIVGIVLGVIARRQIRERDEDGAGVALAGIIASSVVTGLGVLMVLFYVVFFSAIAATGGFSSSTSGRPSPVPGRATTSTERVAPGTTGVRPPGSTAVPSGVIALSACPRVTLALKNLTLSTDADQAILSDAARTLHAELPPTSGDDVDTLLTDAMSRIGVPNAGAPSPEVTAATQRLAAILNAACPS